MKSEKVIVLFYPLVDPDRQIPNLPFSVLNIARMIDGLSLDVIIIDERIIPDYEQKLLKIKDDILLVGVSAMIGYQMVSGKKFSLFCKNVLDVPVVWGGWFVNVLPEIALKESFIDFVVHGQGEYPFRELVIAILNHKEYDKINGIGFNDSGRIVVNPQHQISDEKQFPKIDFSLIDIKKIAEINKSDHNSFGSINYIATIGCPYNCTFCCLATVWGQKTYSKDVSVILSDIKNFYENHNIRKISFDDDHFFGKRNFVIELCTRIVDENIDIEWEANAHIGTFLNNYSDEDIILIRRSGCRSIRFGAESGDQEVLTTIKKKIKVDNSFQVAELLKKHHIKFVMYIMVAFPWNPDKDFKLTLNMVGQAKIINSDLEAGINFFVPLPKTPLYAEGIKYGFKAFEDFQQIVDFIATDYSAPWWKRNYREELHDFLWLYFKYANPKHYKSKDKKIKFINYIVNKAFYPICVLRLKFNFRKVRIDARFYFLLKRLFNWITLNKYADDREAMARTRSWRR
ncbi:MAG: radical SAM protein [Bacteroidales bacterium]|nr:radical SAM protein [Bacteroidales bacterium]